MLQGRAVLVATAALLLEALPLVVAHGHGEDEGSAAGEMDMQKGSRPQNVNGDGASNYWRLSEHAGLMYMHIALEVLAWFVVLPVGRFWGFRKRPLWIGLTLYRCYAKHFPLTNGDSGSVFFSHCQRIRAAPWARL
jgi:hypothetical protein